MSKRAQTGAEVVLTIILVGASVFGSMAAFVDILEPDYIADMENKIYYDISCENKVSIEPKYKEYLSTRITAQERGYTYERC